MAGTLSNIEGTIGCADATVGALMSVEYVTPLPTVLNSSNRHQRVTTGSTHPPNGVTGPVATPQVPDV
jgi:hypothetical protein